MLSSSVCVCVCESMHALGFYSGSLLPVLWLLFFFFSIIISDFIRIYVDARSDDFCVLNAQIRLIPGFKRKAQPTDGSQESRWLADSFSPEALKMFSSLMVHIHHSNSVLSEGVY